jgi:protein TonB
LDVAPPTIPVGIAPPEEVPDALGLDQLVMSVGPSEKGHEGVTDVTRGLIPAEVPKQPAPPQPPPKRERIRVNALQEAKLLFKPDPVYPELARRARVSGTVILDVQIDEEGNVSDIRVLSGHPLFNTAAVEAVRRWKYSPTVLNGEPVPVVATVTVIFRLNQ